MSQALSFPWLAPVWTRLVAWRGALPHAILVRGRQGLGKTALARTYAQWLLCESASKGEAPCGRCEACGWFVQGNHPDFRLIEPEALSAAATENVAEGEQGSSRATAKPSRQIRVDQIRELEDFLAVGTHRSGLRVALIRPAEAMNPSTANALLKALEEPPPGTLFLLVTSQPSRLLPTLRSRCQAIDVPPPSAEVAVAWLRAQGVSAPEAALAYAGNLPLDAAEEAASPGVRERLPLAVAGAFEPLVAADRLQEFAPGEVVDGLQKWVYDALALRFGGRQRYFPAAGAALAALSRTSPIALAQYGRRLARARAEATHPLNPRLFIENLLLQLARLGATHHG